MADEPVVAVATVVDGDAMPATTLVPSLIAESLRVLISVDVPSLTPVATVAVARSPF